MALLCLRLLMAYNVFSPYFRSLSCNHFIIYASNNAMFSYLSNPIRFREEKKNNLQGIQFASSAWVITKIFLVISLFFFYLPTNRREIAAAYMCFSFNRLLYGSLRNLVSVFYCRFYHRCFTCLFDLSFCEPSSYSDRL